MACVCFDFPVKLRLHSNLEGETTINSKKEHVGSSEQA